MAYGAQGARPAARDETGWRRRRTLMTPPDVLARALAAALLDGDWDPKAMLSRMRDAIGAQRPWMRTLVRAVCRRYATPPAAALGDLAQCRRPNPTVSGDASKQTGISLDGMTSCAA